jgi:hypothetical protein
MVVGGRKPAGGLTDRDHHHIAFDLASMDVATLQALAAAVVAELSNRQ